MSDLLDLIEHCRRKQQQLPGQLEIPLDGASEICYREVMNPIKAKTHDTTAPRGSRDPRECRVQTGATLSWLEDGVPYFWVDRPAKFNGAMRTRIEWFERHGRIKNFTDIKWHQLGSRVWYRLPAWPDGIATTERKS